MKQNAYIAGVGMTRFGKHLDRGLKSLTIEAVNQALTDAGLDAKDLQAAYMGNAAAGIIVGQICVPGQMALREIGIGQIPVINIENACASASTAFNQACTMITSGLYDVVLATGAEKLFHPDKLKTFSVFSGAVDVENYDAVEQQIVARAEAAGMKLDMDGAGTKRSVFMDIYASMALEHMEKYGTTQAQFAAVSAKNSFHGSLNPRAQYQDLLTVEQVLSAPEIAYPLTLPMCSPIGDGAAAVVLVSERKAREMGLSDPVKVASSVLRSGWDPQSEDEAGVTETCAMEAYEEAGVGPEDLSCIELHDASAPSELIYYEQLGLCNKGEGGRFVEEGHSKLGGRVPVNTSGGLLRKGHPIGATGIAQIVELTEQLQGRAEGRQVEGARIALAENGGGWINTDAAAVVVSILTK
ncbi:thiolase family protein [Amphritea sp. 2_MG-2023]|uniref:thiolase family protein n=1 Tax=Amphritea TaxID=515417 RepID=UPI001C06B552|nr:MULTISPECIES: thiolase family protein [Amphritea]MBU2964650.1 thiolase family protein [Amphritea atlantica]MDO6420408.1 thiolase family protein [Amphritea sp. 2_MG-2023]